MASGPGLGNMDSQESTWIADLLKPFESEHFTVGFLLDYPHRIEEAAVIAYEQWPELCKEYGVHSAQEFKQKWFDIQNYGKKIPKSLLLLDKKGNLAGCAYVEPVDLPTHPHLGPWLTTMLVMPEYRRRGGAQLLLKATKAIAEQERLTLQACNEPFLYLFVEDTSSDHGKNLLAMYGAHGYRVVEENHYAGCPIAIMRYDSPAASK